MEHLEGGFWAAYRGCFDNLHDLEGHPFPDKEADRYGKLHGDRWVVAVRAKGDGVPDEKTNYNAVPHFMSHYTTFHTMFTPDDGVRQILLWYPDGFGAHFHAYEVLEHVFTAPDPEEDIWL